MDKKELPAALHRLSEAHKNNLPPPTVGDLKSKITEMLTFPEVNVGYEDLTGQSVCGCCRSNLVASQDDIEDSITQILTLIEPYIEQRIKERAELYAKENEFGFQDTQAKDNGYVKLAKDQSLPECFDGNRPRAKAFRDMLKAGWRKVE